MSRQECVIGFENGYRGGEIHRFVFDSGDVTVEGGKVVAIRGHIPPESEMINVRPVECSGALRHRMLIAAGSDNFSAVELIG